MKFQTSRTCVYACSKHAERLSLSKYWCSRPSDEYAALSSCSAPISSKIRWNWGCATLFHCNHHTVHFLIKDALCRFALRNTNDTNCLHGDDTISNVLTGLGLDIFSRNILYAVIHQCSVAFSALLHASTVSIRFKRMRATCRFYVSLHP